MALFIEAVVFLLGGAQTFFQQAVILKITKVHYSIMRLLVSTSTIMAIHVLSTQSPYVFGIMPLVILVLLLVLSYCLIFKQTLLGSVLMCVSQIILGSCVDYLGYLLLIPINTLLQHDYDLWLLIARITGLSVLIIGFFILKKIKISFNFQSFKNSNRFSWAVYSIFLLLFSIPNAIIAYNRRMLTTYIEVYNAAIFIVFFIYNIVYVRSIFKAAEATQKLETQLLYSKTLEASLEELRGFKHDFANIISAMAGYINTGDLASAQRVSDELVKKYLKINTTAVVNIQLKEIPHLYVMILSKLHRAETTNISFSVTVQGELTLKYCEPLDFCRVVGNLLDNALEAAAESEDKFVKLDILTRQGLNNITIKNSYLDQVDANTIFQSGYTTKKGHTGLGLCQIMSVIEKYNKQGYVMKLRTVCEDGIFTQEFVV